MRLRFTGLWHHSNFLKLWAGQTISFFGDQITNLALPLTAILLLKATPTQMGFLGAAQFAPFLLMGLFAGVWIDRMPKRPILIGADIGRAVLLGVIPIAALFNLLRIEYLYVVGFLVGILTTFFLVTYQAFLPLLVEREQLVEANSKIEISRSVTEVSGPGLTGVLVQLITGPIAIIVDSLSFLISARFLGLIRLPEPTPASQEKRRSIWIEIGEGLRVVLANPMLRSIALCSSTFNLFSYIQLAIFVLYATRNLGIGPSILGLILSFGSIGALLGALMAGSAASRFGLGHTIVGAALMAGIGSLFIPLATGPALIAISLLAVGQFLIGLATTTYNINQISLRQAIVPKRLQGRMNASMRFIVWGTIPIGSLIGGVLGEKIGMRPTLVVGAVGWLLSFVWVFFSPLRMLRDQPVQAEEPSKIEIKEGVQEN